MAWLVLAGALLLAFVNGANDNMKGVATLYGSGSLSYRRALTLATVTTALGSLMSVVLATSLVRAFSAKGLLPPELLTPAVLAAIALGAAAAVLIATRAGLPISTTHALLGAIAGTGLAVGGAALDLGRLAALFALPLLASPLLAVALAWSGVRAGREAGRQLGIRRESCVCVGGEWVPADIAGSAAVGTLARTGLPTLGVSVGASPQCRDRYAGQVAGIEVESAVNVGHLLSASAVSFARGLNDTPKILGLLVGAAVLTPTTGAIAIAVAMGLGGVVAARRVADTMARRLVVMTPGEGLAGNLATSILVIAASRFGLPVSTTHVSTGGIFGIGIANGALRRGVALGVLSAWVTTLPLAAALAAGFAVILV